MEDHPCKNGLSPSCYKAYPGWVERALAYKLLQIILPKQIISKIKSGLEVPLIGQGAILPNGVEVPPGSIIPPDLSVPGNWPPWFNLKFHTSKDPRKVFPVGWTIKEPLPKGVEVNPGYVIPENWTPENPPHPVYLPGFNPFPNVSDFGASPPLYVGVWEPGPVTPPGPIIPHPEQEIILLSSQGPGNEAENIGDDDTRVAFAASVSVPDDSYITSIKIKIGKSGSPVDGVYVNFLVQDGDGKPNGDLLNGCSDLVLASELPDFSLSQDFIEFNFTNKPVMDGGVKHYLKMYRTGGVEAGNFYQVLGADDPWGACYWQDILDDWDGVFAKIVECEIWGYKA